MSDVILTGIRSNDTPTLGNYLGGMLPMVDLQKKYASDYQINMFVPDLHSFTTPIDHDQLYQATITNLTYFVAAGLDITHSNTYLYRQSYISAHSELAWILDCFTYVGEMNRMTEFKDKAKQQDSVSVGLFNYPVLMAADILLYGAKWVPVGDDQKQHLEITRDIALRMNNKFGHIFVVPEPWEKQLAFTGSENGVRIRSLQNPEKKMSKSISDPKGTILLTDDPTDAAKKVISATTDSFGDIQFDFIKRPGVSNLLQMAALLSGQPIEKTLSEWAGKSQYGDLKKYVAELVEEFLRAFQSKVQSVDRSNLESTLEADESAMTKVANQTLLHAQQAVGLRPKGN